MIKTKKLSAFTLIELLVVIVIIGILSGIGISKFKDYNKKTENLQRSTHVNYYINALLRMSASSEDFPISVGESHGNFPNYACMIKSNSNASSCWDNNYPIFPITSVDEQFKKHIQGINDIKSIHLPHVNRIRTGVIYGYPLANSSLRNHAITNALNPDKTAFIQWGIDQPDFVCKDQINTPKNKSFFRQANNYAGGTQTLCTIFIEN